MQPGEFVNVALSYHSQLWNAALRMARDRAEAEDFLQETYRRAFEHGSELRHLSHCRAWLFRILTALVIDMRRREQRSPVLTVVDGGGAVHPRAKSEASLDAAPPPRRGRTQVGVMRRDFCLRHRIFRGLFVIRTRRRMLLIPPIQPFPRKGGRPSFVSR